MHACRLLRWATCAAVAGAAWLRAQFFLGPWACVCVYAAGGGWRSDPRWGRIARQRRLPHPHPRLPLPVPFFRSRSRGGSGGGPTVRSLPIPLARPIGNGTSATAHQRSSETHTCACQSLGAFFFTAASTAADALEVEAGGRGLLRRLFATPAFPGHRHPLGSPSLGGRDSPSAHLSPTAWIQRCSPHSSSCCDGGADAAPRTATQALSMTMSPLQATPT
jgi:hypothetical protein